MNGYVAGWDGGGTKTLCETRALRTEETHRFTAGALNPNGTAAGQTEAAVAQLLAHMARLPGGVQACKMLCIGAAGISNPTAAQKLHMALQQGGYSGPVVLTGDDQTALYGALGDAGGMVLIAGTGSICYGQNSAGVQARAGGWGSLMDDEGGGYALGRDALAAVVRAEDGRIPPTVLRTLVFEALGVQDVRQMLHIVYAPQTGKREIAALAPLVEQAARTEDSAALHIVRKAGRELAGLVCPVAHRLGLQQAPIAFAGSVLLHCEPVRRETIRALETALPHVRVVKAAADAARGAVLLAYQAWEKQCADT